MLLSRVCISLKYSPSQYKAQCQHSVCINQQWPVVPSLYKLRCIYTIISIRLRWQLISPVQCDHGYNNIPPPSSVSGNVHICTTQQPNCDSEQQSAPLPPALTNSSASATCNSQSQAGINNYVTKKETFIVRLNFGISVQNSIFYGLTDNDTNYIKL